MARFLKPGDHHLKCFVVNAVRINVEKKRLDASITFYRNGSKLDFKVSDKRHNGKTTFEISKLIIPETLQPDWDEITAAIYSALDHLGFAEYERWNAIHVWGDLD